MSDTHEIVVVDAGDFGTTVEFRKNGEVLHARGGRLSLSQVDAAIAHYRTLAPDADTYWTDRAETYRAPDRRTIDISGMPWSSVLPYALDDEGMTYDADDRVGMPTVWASDHAAVVAERDRLRDALKPFVWDDEDYALMAPTPDSVGVRTMTTMGDVRRAREALKGGGDE